MGPNWIGLSDPVLWLSGKWLSLEHHVSGFIWESGSAPVEEEMEDDKEEKLGSQDRRDSGGMGGGRSGGGGGGGSRWRGGGAGRGLSCFLDMPGED